MKKFIRQCYCEENGMEFESDNKYDATSVNILYCPKCVQYAWNNTLLVRIKEAFDIEPGIWGIKFNKEMLREQDRDYKEENEYLIDLFKGNKIIFSFLKSSDKHEILGIKADLSDGEYEKMARNDIDKDMRKKHNPKRIKKL